LSTAKEPFAYWNPVAQQLRKLSETEITEGLASTSGWSLIEGEISKTFTFESYKDGIVFASVIGHLADQADHHPNILIGYRRVTVSVNTHDVGGISEKDFALAEKIDALA
jgi:4a-hydroxytetrahydrobiopterin dehydratase